MTSIEADAVRRRRFDLSPAAWVLVGMVGAYIAVFGTLTWQQQSNFGTFGFDMGIYDQGIWLVSRFREPLLTVRGLNYFGHHVNLITLLFVPFYWFGAGPHFLYLVETVVMAAGAVPIWLLVRDKTQHPWLALIPPAAYLLFPSLEWMNWWHFHPDALTITPLLFAWWLASRAKWRWFAVAVACALLAKEDAALAVLVLGLVLIIDGHRRKGLQTAIAGAAYFLLATKLIIPIANHGRPPFYEEFFPGFGHSMFAIAWTIVRHPSKVYDVAFLSEQLKYYRQLLYPVGGLAFGSPITMLIGGPQMLVNVVSLHSPTHDIHYHYSAVPTAAIFISTAETYALAVKHNAYLRTAGAVWLAGCAVVANVAWSPSPLGRDYEGAWVKPAPRHAAVNEALKLVRPGDGVAATFYIVPHLTHRTYIYEFPNPFIVQNWGVNGERPPNPKTATVLVLDTTVNGTMENLYEDLVGPQGEFKIVFDKDGVIVARRKPSR